MNLLVAGKKTRLDRMAICEACEHYRTDWPIPYCGICKCFIVSKCTLQISECPEGKWGRASPDDIGHVHDING